MLLCYLCAIFVISLSSAPVRLAVMKFENNLNKRNGDGDNARPHRPESCVSFSPFARFELRGDSTMRHSDCRRLLLLRLIFTRSSKRSNSSFVLHLRLQSKVLGQHVLPKGSNLAEGIVIKPLEPILVQEKGKESTTGVSAPQLQFLIKLKNPAFSDISDDFSTPVPTPILRLLSLANARRVVSLLS